MPPRANPLPSRKVEAQVGQAYAPTSHGIASTWPTATCLPDTELKSVVLLLPMPLDSKNCEPNAEKFFNLQKALTKS